MGRLRNCRCSARPAEQSDRHDLRELNPKALAKRIVRGEMRKALVGEERMPVAAPWNQGLAEQLIAAELRSAREFYGADGLGATALLPILHAVQQRFGYVPAAAVSLIAERLNLSKADVKGVISFYHDFLDAPAPRHLLKLCRAEACQARGSENLAAHLETAHGLSAGGSKGAVMLQNTYCLGNCALGPAALVDDELLARLDESSVDALMARLQQGAP